MTGKLMPWISTTVAIVVTVIIWKLVIAVFDVSPFVLPQPEDVIGGMGDLIDSDGFWTDVRITLTETLVGFAIALVLGVVEPPGPDSSSSPHAESSTPPPLTAANAPAARPMNARRVHGVLGVHRPSPLPSRSICTASSCCGDQVLARVLSIVDSCHGISSRLRLTTAR